MNLFMILPERYLISLLLNINSCFIYITAMSVGRKEEGEGKEDKGKEDRKEINKIKVISKQFLPINNTTILISEFT